jgi:hypothetical protein
MKNTGSSSDARNCIARLWPKRHGDPALRVSLRRLIRLTKEARDRRRLEAECEYEAAWWADTSYPL